MSEQLVAAKDWVVFKLDRWRYAIAATKVIEVAPVVTVVPLPKAPPIVTGIINLRGSLVPVLDIRSRFNLAPKPMDIMDHFLIASMGDRAVALHVDCVVGLTSISPDAIEDASRSVPPTASAYVAGVAKLPDGLILIHDLATFLSRAEADQLAALEIRETAG